MSLTMTDLFCGAGGSSTGAVGVPGVDVRLAANHWDLAIETHNANHPDTDHLQADISNTDPRYVATTDILWASPECTNHSRAKGRKIARQPDLFGDILPDAAAERSRATMWDVVRFTEVHGYKAILVENVVEVADWSAEWGERGGLFRSWLSAMHSMGYAHRVISLNSMHAQAYGMPAPQSRDRVYIAFWRRGDKAPDFEHMLRPKAYCGSCDEVVLAMQSFKKGDGSTPGRYRSQYVYRCPKVTCRYGIVEPGWLPAETIIDWTNPGIRIGDREARGMKALAEKTMKRIQAGMDRYWSPIHLEAAGNAYDATNPKHSGHGREDGYIRAWPMSEPVRTIHTTVSKGMAWHPLMVPVEGRDGKAPMSALDALRTMTTRNETGLLFPPLVVNNVSGSDAMRSTRADDVLPTIVAGGSHASVVMPALIAELRGGGSTARPARDALATVTASGNHHALVTPAGGSWNDNARPASDPMRSLTTREAYGVARAGKSKPVDIDDVYFRMLEPGEIKQAMAFPEDYVMQGNRREQVKLSGNAVTPPAARDLIATVASAYGYGAAA